MSIGKNYSIKLKHLQNVLVAAVVPLYKKACYNADMQALKHTKNGFINDNRTELYPYRIKRGAVALYLSLDVLNAVEKIAKQRGLTKSRVVDMALTEILLSD